MNLYGLAVLMVGFGLALLILDLLLFALTPRLLERLDLLRPARRARAIMGVRFAPFTIATALTAFVLVPAWFRHEPLNTGETISGPLLAAALIALLPLVQGLRRGARMLVKTQGRLLAWRRRGRNASRVLASFEVVEVRGEDLALCVGGYLKPAIYASTEVMRSLEPCELSAALAHEVSHARARDPLRLLGMGACPDFLPLFRLDEAWRRAFARACEFAADAGAGEGDPEVALDLAAALVKLARLRTFRLTSIETALEVAVSSASSGRLDLEARVEALTHRFEPTPVDESRSRPWMLVALGFLIAGAGWIASEQVHSLTESLGRLLAS